jgi:putative membrane protein
VDLRGFERGAKTLFSFPSSKRLALAVVATALLALYMGCSQQFLLYILVVLPMVLRFAARSFITFRRAYGMVPLFLLWGAFMSHFGVHSPLMVVPPSLLMAVPVRFLSSSKWKRYLPAALALPAVAAQTTNWVYLTVTAVLTLAVIFSVELYAVFLRKQLDHYGGIELFEAYLSYTLVRDKETLERALLDVSSRRSIPVYALDLLDESGVWGIIVVPHVHPGPYRDVGSSRLPFHVLESASKRGLECVVFHGASTHSEDLVSELDARRLAEATVSGVGEILCEGHQLGVGSYTDGTVRAVAFALEGGWNIVFTERVNGGMEDIPLNFAEEIGPHTVLVDLHNGFDEPRPSPTLDDALGKSLVSCARAAIGQALSGIRDGWTIGVASLRSGWEDEIGSAGVSAFTLARNGECVFVVVYDANNMVRSYRDRLYELTSQLCTTTLIATSDTHELTGSRAGSTYHPLGYRYPLDSAWASIKLLYSQATQSCKPLRYRLRRFYVDAQFLDPIKLEELSKRTDKLVNGALLLFAFVAALFAVPLLFR